jgi:hypothetical protein
MAAIFEAANEMKSSQASSPEASIVLRRTYVQWGMYLVYV